MLGKHGICLPPPPPLKQLRLQDFYLCCCCCCCCCLFVLFSKTVLKLKLSAFSLTPIALRTPTGGYQVMENKDTFQAAIRFHPGHL